MFWERKEPEIDHMEEVKRLDEVIQKHESAHREQLERVCEALNIVIPEHCLSMTVEFKEPNASGKWLPKVTFVFDAWPKVEGE